MSTVQQVNVKNVALALLVPSQTEAQKQRRAHFDQGALQLLADNVASVGLVNPILVRPLGEKFEIVAGERRFQAAKLAKLSEIPCSIRDLDDGQVLELQLIENLQREGLHELHEAEGYEALRKRGLTAIEIAAKVNKSKEYVFGRMKLLALCKEVRSAFYDNQISAAVALLIARIPVEDLQKKALKDVTDTKYGRSPMSYREAMEHLQQNYMLRLDQAPFDIADATLLKSAVACGGCPKNTVQQKELFGDVKGGSAGVCTDPVCFKAKTKAGNDKVVAKAKEEGKIVITGAAAKKIFPWDHSEDTISDGAGYVNPSAKNFSDPKQRTWRELAGKDAELVTVVNPHTQKPVQLLTKIEVAAGMKRQGISIKSASSSPAPKSPQQKTADKKAEAKERLEGDLRLEVGKQLMERASKPLHRDELVMILDLVEAHDSRMGQFMGDLVKVSPKKATELELLKLIRAHLYYEAVLDTYTDTDLFFATAKRAGVNIDSVRKSLSAASTEKEKKSADAPPAKAKSKSTKSAKKK